MKTKSLILLLLVLSVAAAARSLKTKTFSPTQQPADRQGWANPNWEDPTALKNRIKPAKAKGERKVTIPGPLIRYDTRTSSLDEATSKYSAVVVRPIEKRSFSSGARDIRTFYKFEVIEFLSRSSSTLTTEYIQIPDGLIAPKENEIYVPVSGGTITVDEVEVTEQSEFDVLSIGSTYLMFLTLEASGKFGLLHLGPAGVFEIDSRGALKSIAKKSSQFKEDIEQNYKSLLNTKNKIEYQSNLR